MIAASLVSHTDAMNEQSKNNALFEWRSEVTVTVRAE